MESVESYVYRARFQPFCRDHYEVIQAFWKRFVKDRKNGEPECHLYLWAVRSLRTTAINVHPHDINGDITGRPELFRHRVEFNPFRFPECVRIFRRDLRFFLDSDKQELPDQSKEEFDKFKEWLSVHLHILSVPFSIDEMTNYWHDSKGHIYEAIDPVDQNYQKLNGKFRSLFDSIFPNTSQVLNEEFNDKRNVSWFEIAKSLVARFQDTGSHDMPHILLPMFDHQDTLDHQKLKVCNWQRYYCYLDWVDPNRRVIRNGRHTDTILLVKTPDRIEQLSAQNAFIYYALLLYLGEDKSKGLYPQEQSYGDEIKLAEDFLEGRSSKQTITLFKENVIDYRKNHATQLEAGFAIDAVDNLFNMIRMPNTAPDDAEQLSPLWSNNSDLHKIRKFVEQNWTEGDLKTRVGHGDWQFKSLLEKMKDILGQASVKQAMMRVSLCDKPASIDREDAKTILEYDEGSKS
ncbi:hypothetical protein [Candidatus Thiosymbion oneisti]|uniref:hypothetical protein n=1 Tax=Candidatus Thiosymbion oneisti TaxID=589554 RepID=UPI00114D2DF6|nr:hypothetical protein [Candidatus Thiosymbion oneisti]